MWKLSLLLTAAAALGGFGAAWKIQDWRGAAAQLQAAKGVVRVVERQADASQTIAVADQRAQDRIRTVTHTLIERVPIYVSPSTDARFALPWGFVRLHDAAAVGDDLSAAAADPGRPDDAASPVTASGAAAVIAANYGDCRADQARLADLQSWARQVGLAR
jgi:hypothetical protein